MEEISKELRRGEETREETQIETSGLTSVRQDPKERGGRRYGEKGFSRTGRASGTSDKTSTRPDRIDSTTLGRREGKRRGPCHGER